MTATKWVLQYDLRRAPTGASYDELYTASLEQAAWADTRGCASVMLPEHHCTDDGYMPAPVVLGGALAAVTRSMRLDFTALLLTLQDPVRIAEDLMVLDRLSHGRVELTIGIGYVPREFTAMGEDLRARGRNVDQKLPAFLQALSGEEFEYHGRRGRLTPPAHQQPRPPVLIGGSTRASARRAARFGDGFVPIDHAAIKWYVEECEGLGHEPGPVVHINYPLSVHVTTDPDRTWAAIGPFLMHQYREYMNAANEGDYNSSWKRAGAPIDDVDGLRESKLFGVVTPDECVELATTLGPSDCLRMNPLVGGTPAEHGWESLELFVNEVVPRIELRAPAPVAPVRPTTVTVG